MNDHLGNNRVVANSSGTLVQKNHYYPFGSVFASTTGAEMQPYKYNGKELDAMHGVNLYDYSARYMDSQIGRFTSVDQLAEKFYSWSPYVYTFNNPLRFTDPTGENPIDEILKALKQVGNEILSSVGLSGKQIQSDNPAVLEDASQKRQEFTETMHTVNETMLSVVPAGDVAYKVANDREVTTGDAAWAAAGVLPVGKVAKGVGTAAKGVNAAAKGTAIWSKTKNASAVENALGHWQKHGKEFSEFQNAKQYVEGAKDFLHNSPSGTLMKTRPNGAS
ncbi:hypothetical protein D0T84_20735 [Dysgonomonas sp. 521]|nr:hypothetical protein [Dysgonomonas sp. 521]